ncbi:GL22755 [Drosophila persimilis]|uniref:Uncharacterized protein n=2 Tax=pseudoobscura subgroup TaxID=32358 RepID=A0A6I8W749_DROPS|nr:uncharacterized protein LOC108150936 [Drosophila miranda]XP_033239132.1 uncharacterized protein LOC117184654 [Drosophila pseudoobscura]EDW29476.1 GL22755 [Drosophila persimilis]
MKLLFLVTLFALALQLVASATTTTQSSVTKCKNPSRCIRTYVIVTRRRNTSG